MLVESILTMVTDPAILLAMFVGVVVGIIFGSVPGLTATMAITICLPLTYSMSSAMSVAVLISLYIGGISGGLISAILLNMPGTPSSIATTFDGVPMMRQGYASRALGIGVVYSFLGTLFGAIALMCIAPALASIAIEFTPFEYCALAIFSLSVVVALAGKDFLKGLISAVLGLMLATVGLSPVDSMKRFTFGNVSLNAGIQLLAILIGVYALTEVAQAAYDALHPKEISVKNDIGKTKGFGFSMREFKANIGNFITSASIGTGIGILPGIGGAAAGMLAYTASKTRSKEPEKFGTGCMEGIVASESSNNAVIGGALVPLLTLGIPGDSATAMLLGGLMIHGVVPGPLIFQKYGDVVYYIYFAIIVAAIFMLIAEWFGMRIFIKVLSIPRNILLPLVVVMCFVGAFGDSNRAFSVALVVAFGIFGYILSNFKIPIPPLVLAFILGPTFETNLRRVAQYVTLDPSTLYQHPIANVLIVMAIAIVFLILRSRKKQTLRQNRTA